MSDVVLEFELRDKHALIVDEEGWAKLVEDINRSNGENLPTSADDESLSEVWKWFESSGWRAEEFLVEIAGLKNTWYDTDWAEVHDLRVE